MATAVAYVQTIVEPKEKAQGWAEVGSGWVLLGHADLAEAAFVRAHAAVDELHEYAGDQYDAIAAIVAAQGAYGADEAARQSVARALELFATFESESIVSRAATNLFKTLANAGLWEDALAVDAWHQDEDDHFSRLAELASIYAGAGEDERANEVLDQIQRESETEITGSNYFRALVDLGRWEEAMALARRDFDANVVVGIGDLMAIAGAQADSGMTEQPLALVDEALALVDQFAALAPAGTPKSTIAIAAVLALSEIAATQAVIGQDEGATQSFETALDLLSTLSDEEIEESRFGNPYNWLIRSLAGAGYVSWAIDIAGAELSGYDQYSAYRTIPSAVPDVASWSAAMDAVADMDDASVRAKMLATAAVEYAKAGLDDDADSLLLEAIEAAEILVAEGDISDGSIAYDTVALAMVDMGMIDRAAMLADQSPGGFTGPIWKELIIAWTEAGEIEKAEAALVHIAHPISVSETAVVLARAYIEMALTAAGVDRLEVD